ncbi:helix-turn-helix transcriptional regulator [Aquimarina aggregata]|uniref:helix-turn-helix transcriptional regulator n=1 Tax=Aquimarina aggregata TaxID=1642818 RepID=UPI0034E25343
MQEYKELEQCAFLYYLKKKHPILSDTDLRHCLFVLLEYSLKETSRVLSININTVKTSRYRARKKINIPKSITLKKYLQNFNQNINRNYA